MNSSLPMLLGALIRLLLPASLVTRLCVWQVRHMELITRFQRVAPTDLALMQRNRASRCFRILLGDSVEGELATEVYDAGMAMGFYGFSEGGLPSPTALFVKSAWRPEQLRELQQIGNNHGALLYGLRRHP